ncbi:MAG: 2-dehydropantoate 2-reductase [Pseudomonadota bacterium]|nr:2-dehydropantoate 2-reductase [Pseudomonadota bacterium]
MRFAIYGAGGLGAYYGARLADAGEEVGFIARGSHLTAIQSNGLKVFSPIGDIHLSNPLASSDPTEIGPVDVVIVAVKTWQIPDVAAAIGPLIQDNTIVIPFLNGVEAADQLAKVVGDEKVFGGLSRVFSEISAPGVIRHMNPSAYVEFGELSGTTSPRANALRDVFEHAGVEATVSEDIRSALWAKLLYVSSWSGLSALSRSPMGELLGQPELCTLVNRSIDEGIAVGEAMNYNLSNDLKASMWAFYEGLPAQTTASMTRDILAGKPSELDAWNGAIVRFGRELNVATPVHEFTYHTLLPMERRARTNP